MNELIALFIYIILIMLACASLANFSNYLNKTPAVCIDVDGVLKLGKSMVPGATEAIMKLRYEYFILM